MAWVRGGSAKLAFAPSLTPNRTGSGNNQRKLLTLVGLAQRIAGGSAGKAALGTDRQSLKPDMP